MAFYPLCGTQEFLATLFRNTTFWFAFPAGRLCQRVKYQAAVAISKSKFFKLKKFFRPLLSGSIKI
ncbi:MAG: hypothetical protein E5V81_04910 [Mesorhizobium sp.]|nr:MAG: hypothetical protein E5V81_04910 [Mesorhizobium sp.]